MNAAPNADEDADSVESVRSNGSRSVVAVLAAACLCLVGCGPDFDQLTTNGQRLADEAGATVVRVDRVEEDGGAMYSDDPTHVELFATLEADPTDVSAVLRSAGERLGYNVTGELDMYMNRDDSILNVRVTDESAVPIKITIASLESD